MRSASVGFQCPSCSGQNQPPKPRRSRRVRTTGDQPVVIYTIMAICVAAYVLTMLSGGAASPLHEWGAMLGRTAVTSDGAVVTGVADGGWWRLVTSAFLHYPVLPMGLLHLVLNLYGLYAFGPYAESVLGRGRFLISYLTMAVGASVAVYWLSDPLVPTIGASGAVFGLLGFALVVLKHEGGDVTALLVLLVINAFMSLQGGISWQAHAGGLVVGLILGAAVALAPRQSWRATYALVTGALWLGFALVLSARTLALLASGITPL